MHVLQIITYMAVRKELNGREKEIECKGEQRQALVCSTMMQA